ncbi:MAG: DEAD/DEAH box helicase [Desulfohalobiaceae bacterium]|nr:DEAD/DEAH box helicase [Desulfohalobiaceae bacterium]
MTNLDDTRLQKITKEFLEENIPEYILEKSRDLINANGVHNLKITRHDDSLDLNGRIQSDDFQVYNPEVSLNLNEGSTNFICNCPDSFTGICPHVGATLVEFMNTLDQDQPEAELTSKTDWRQTFRPFFASAPEPEAGNNYLIFRFYPEPERLQVALFRARQNKSGLSRVQNQITLNHLIEHPEWCETSPTLPDIANQLGHYLDYFGHRVEIPPGLLNWFLSTVKDEPYLFWQDTEQPVSVETQNIRLGLKPDISEQGLRFDILLTQEDKAPFSISGQEVYFFGRLPLWVLWQKKFYPVFSSLDSNLVQKLVYSPPVIPKSDLSEFLDRVWTKIPSSNLYGQEEFLELMQPIFVQAEFNPKLFLNEEGSLLTIEIQNVYETEHGEVTLDGPNPDYQTGSYQFENKSFLIRRDQTREKELLDKLTEMRFQSRNKSVWFVEPEEAINFLLDNYPTLVEQYRVFGEQSLSKYRVRHSMPKVVAAVEKDEENTDWFDLNVSVEYDNQRISIEKIWKAWTQGKRYVQLKDGSYTSLPESWLKNMEHKLRAMGMDTEKPLKKKFQKFEAPVLENLLEDMPEARTDSFWNTLKEKINHFEQIEQLPTPTGLEATLRPYQLQGMSYMNFLYEYGFGGILADEMGLGKTLQTLSLLQHFKNHGKSGPSLIIVPTSVLPNWQREVQKFTPGMKCLIIYGSKRDHLFKEIPSCDLVVTTYALLRRDLEDLNKYEFRAVFLDEAQNIKNPNTITARSVRKLKTGFKVCLSGTPIENNLLELWSLFEFLMPGFLGSQNGFQKGFVKPIKDGDQESMEYLRTRVKPFILRRTKNEVARDLPPKVENVYYSALIEEQKELYTSLAKKLKEQVLQKVEEEGIAQSQMSILDALLKLRQICCHPRLLKLDMPGVSSTLPSGKFEAFKDLVTGIMDDGHKILVFSQFVKMLHIIRSWLSMNKIPFSYLDGSSKDRFDQVDAFNNDPNIPIFLISLKAGGTGLNLTSADYVIHYDPWWNPAVENQATDRTHRIGQTRKVFSYKMITENSVEEKILKLQEEKKGVADAIIPGQDQWKSLTRNDLESLFEI